jgi:hypothetical protein
VTRSTSECCIGGQQPTSGRFIQRPRRPLQESSLALGSATILPTPPAARLRSCLAPQAHRASDPCSESPITASVSAVSCTGGFGFFWYGCAAPGAMVGAIGGAAAAGVDDVSLEATTGPESCGVTDLTSTASPWSPGVSSQRFQNAACLVGHGSSPQARCKQRLHASARPPPT